MGKSAPAAPPPPDPVLTAQAQGVINADTARLQNRLNRVDEFGPLGSRTFEDLGNDRFSATTSLTPAGQEAFDNQQALNNNLSGLASSQFGRVEDTLGTPFSFDGAPQLPGVNDFGAERSRVEDAVFGRFANRINPRFDRQGEQLETRLANQGIGRGTEAFNESFENLERDRTDALSLAQNDAVLAGGQEQSRLFGLGATARERAIQEQSILRNQPINDVAALLGNSQLSIPQFGGISGAGVNGVDLVGLQQSQFNNLNQQNLAQQQAAAANNQAAFGLGASALTAAATTAAAFSSKEYKNRISATEPVLEKVDKLVVDRWKYKPEFSVYGKTHIGPYAEDWHKQFKVGDDKTISLIDGLGVCLKAIQELSSKVKQLEEEKEHATV